MGLDVGILASGGGGVSQGSLDAHTSATTGVHGITDTAQIALKDAANTFTLAQLFPDGSASAPSVAIGASNYGFYKSGTLLGISTAGTSRFTVDSTKVAITVPLRSGNGSLSSPAFSFTSETNSGLSRSGSGVMQIGVLGTEVMRFSSTFISPYVAMEMQLPIGLGAPTFIDDDYTLTGAEPGAIVAEITTGKALDLPDPVAVAAGSVYFVANLSTSTANLTVDCVATGIDGGAVVLAPGESMWFVGDIAWTGKWIAK